MSSQKIAERVEKCQGIFGAMMKQYKDGRNLHQWLEGHRYRLNWIADHMGVSADHERSIHYKLAENPDSATSMLEVLEAFVINLKLLETNILERTATSAASSRLREGEIDGSAASALRPGSVGDEKESTVGSCQEHIKNSLHSLDTAARELVRRCAVQSAVRSREFQPLSADGEPLEPAFKCFIENTLQAFHASHQHVAQHCMEDWLKERLRETMNARWRHISCRRDKCAGTLKSSRYASDALSYPRRRKGPMRLPAPATQTETENSDFRWRQKSRMTPSISCVQCAG
jgi:hypothetical protein